MAGSADTGAAEELTVYIALLRAVNVGGTGKLQMTELVAMCHGCGFLRPKTYIASGNVVFESPLGAHDVKAVLEERLERYAAKPVGVMIRTAAEMGAVLAANPFPHANPSRTVAIFLDDPPASDSLEKATGVKTERFELGVREIYVHYGDGMAHSKLKIRAASAGTARNMNTVAKLSALAAQRCG